MKRLFIAFCVAGLMAIIAFLMPRSEPGLASSETSVGQATEASEEYPSSEATELPTGRAMPLGNASGARTPTKSVTAAMTEAPPRVPARSLDRTRRADPEAFQRIEHRSERARTLGRRLEARIERLEQQAAEASDDRERKNLERDLVMLKRNLHMRRQQAVLAPSLAERPLSGANATGTR